MDNEFNPTTNPTSPGTGPTSEPEFSSRGFAHMDPIPSEYGGEVKVYESSGIDPAIWVRVSCPSDLNDLRSTPIEATALVGIENARVLRDQLDWLISQHDED